MVLSTLTRLAGLLAAPCMQLRQHPRPAEPIDAADAAQSLVDMGLAPYEEARADIEAARAEVAADGVGDECIGCPV